MYSNGGIYIPDRKPPLGAVRNPHLPINQGLVLDAMMNEGSGNTVQDLSGNGNTGTLASAVVWSTGQFGAAAEFNGDENTRITMPDSPAYSGLSQITVSFWMYPHSLETADDTKMVVGKANWNDNREWRVRIEQNGNFIWQISNDGNDPGTNECSVDASNYLTIGKWSHIVGTYDGTTLWLYIDGVQVDTNAGDGGACYDGSAVLAIGAASDLGGTAPDAYDGLVDDVMIYNRALSASEIQPLYREPFCGYRWESIIELASYVAAAGGSSVAKIMQQMNQFNGGQAA